MNYFLVVTLLFSGIVSASEYPIVTSISTKINSPVSASYSVSIAVMDIGTAADVPVPNGWTVGIGHRHDNFPGGIDVGPLYAADRNCDPGGCSIIAKNNMTLGQAAMAAYRKGGSLSRFSLSHIGEGNGGECVGFYAVAKPTSISWGNVLIPPGACVYAPPGQDWCKIITPEITFNHGVLQLSEAAGHSRSTKININCTSGTTVKLRLMNNQSYVELQNGLRSDIFIEGQAPAVSLRLQAGANAVNMSDKLTGVINPGGFYGSSVLVMEPM